MRNARVIRRLLVFSVASLVALTPGESPAADLDPMTPLTPGSFASRDGVGSSVAFDGAHLVTGAQGVDSPGCSSNLADCTIRGGAFAFEFVVDTWVERPLPSPNDLGDGSLFGISVDLDGTTCVIGAPGGGFTGSRGDTGAAYVYVFSNGSWQLQQKLTTSDASADDLVGWDVAIDGETIVVGAPGEDTGGAQAGAAYVFTRSGTTWTEQQRIQWKNIQPGDGFGRSVDIDGGSIIAGASGAFSIDGAAYVFVGSGNAWTEQAELRAAVPPGQAQLGWDVAIDGDVAVVGENGLAETSGALVFQRDGTTWSEVDVFLPDSSLSAFTQQVAVAVEDDLIALGFAGEVVNMQDAAGQVFLYRRTQNIWLLDSRLTHDTPETSDRFGDSLDLRDGKLVIGAPRADDGVADGGAVYVPDGAPGGGGGGGNTPPPGTIRSFVLPTRVAVRVGPGKGKPGVKAAAVFDTGTGAVDFTQPATLTVGPRTIQLPGLTSQKSGRRFGYSDDTLKLTVTPSKKQTSRAVMKLALSEDLGATQDLDGDFTLAYVGGGVDATGTATLDGGAFKFGKRAGALTAPAISVKKAKAKIRGNHRDQFVVQLGFTTPSGNAPQTPPDLSLAFGDLFNATIPGGSFDTKGAKHSFKGNTDGITSVVIDYAKERAVIKAKNIDLGVIAQGPVPLLLIFDRGDDERAVEVLAVRGKSKLSY